MWFWWCWLVYSLLLASAAFTVASWIRKKMILWKHDTVTSDAFLDMITYCAVQAFRAEFSDMPRRPESNTQKKGKRRLKKHGNLTIMWLVVTEQIRVPCICKIVLSFQLFLLLFGSLGFITLPKKKCCLEDFEKNYTTCSTCSSIKLKFPAHNPSTSKFLLSRCLNL